MFHYTSCVICCVSQACPVLRVLQLPVLAQTSCSGGPGFACWAPCPGRAVGRTGTGPVCVGLGALGPASPQDARSHLLLPGGHAAVGPWLTSVRIGPPRCVRPAQDRTFASGRARGEACTCMDATGPECSRRRPSSARGAMGCLVWFAGEPRCYQSRLPFTRERWMWDGGWI